MVLQVPALTVSNLANILVRCTAFFRAKIFALKKASASDHSWHLKNHPFLSRSIAESLPGASDFSEAMCHDST